MWLDLLDDAERVVARRPADALPCLVGRDAEAGLVGRAEGLEGRHAAITRDEYGTLHVRDLGTAAGLRRPGDATRLEEATLRAGEALLLGAARLRLTAAPAVETAAPFAGAVPTPARTTPGAPLPRWLAWSARRDVRIAAPLALAAGAALLSWATDASSTRAKTAGYAALGFLMLEAAWVAGWAIATRVRRGAWRFWQHFAVGTLTVLVGLVLGEAGSWITFLAPSESLSAALTVAISVLLWLLAVAMHLGVYGAALRRRGLAVTLGLAAAFGACTVWVNDSEDERAIEFSAELKPLPARLVPAIDPAEMAARFSEVERALLDDEDPPADEGTPPGAADSTAKEE